MNTGRYILSQVVDLVHWQTPARLVDRYHAESRVQHLGCRQQLIGMAFAQLTWRKGLRNIATCLNAKSEALHHLERVKGIEPSCPAWEAGVLPLNYTRSFTLR